MMRISFKTWSILAIGTLTALAALSVVNFNPSTVQGQDPGKSEGRNRSERQATGHEPLKRIDIADIFGDIRGGDFVTRRNKLIESMKPMPSPDAARAMLDKVNVPSVRVVPSFSSAYDLTSMGLGKGVYLPIDLRSRNSVYEILPRQSLVLGMFVTDQGIYLRRVTSLGDGPVEEGSPMRIEIVDNNGQARKSADGKLVIKDRTIGHGYIECDDKDMSKASTWWGWSFYAEVDAAK